MYYYTLVSRALASCFLTVETLFSCFLLLYQVLELLLPPKTPTFLLPFYFISFYGRDHRWGTPLGTTRSNGWLLSITLGISHAVIICI